MVTLNTGQKGKAKHFNDFICEKLSFAAGASKQQHPNHDFSLLTL